MTYDELVRASRDAALACESGCKIVAWNHAAEELLGLPRGDAIGKSFHDLLPARDSYGNRFCTCVVNPLTSRGEVVRHQVIFVPTPAKVWLKVSLCTMALTSSPRGGAQVLYLRPMEWSDSEPAAPRDGASGRRNGHTLSATAPGVTPALANGHAVVAAPETMELTVARWRLTKREVEVLRSMMAGKCAKEIAQQLDVSTETVRNHVRNLLRKLKVHSKLEAVALVFGRGPGPSGESPSEPAL